MRTLRRPMFRKGGFANEGIMHGLERKGYANGSEWENTTQSEWEDIAKTYGMSGAVSTDYEDPKNIEKWSEPINYDFFNWLASDKVAEQKKIEEEKTHAAAVAAAAAGKIPGRGDEGMYYKYPDSNIKIEKPTGNIDDISISDLNKERMKIFAPHMQKRMIADALGAASESFEKSTGDTKQDIARAISAAAKGIRGSTDLADKVSLLTLKGEIEKDIESSKKIKPSNFESAVTAWMDIKDAKGEPKYSLEEALEKASGTKTESTRFYEIQEKFGKGEAIADQQKNNPKFWGSYNKLDKRELKKLPDEAIGMIIYDETENSFYTITVDEEGTKKKEFLSRA